MRAKLALLGMVLGAGLAVGVSCADKPPVGLIVAIQTNLSVTKDFDQLGLYITADGVPILTQTYAIEGGNVRLPSTIAIAPPKNENAVIRVRAVAFKSDAAKVLREGITTVPTTRLAVMPLPLKWLDLGSGKGTEAEWQVNPFASARSICPDLQTQKNGMCTTSSFAVDQLPDYVASEIFGGGSEDGTGSACFDVGTCFGSRTAVPVDDTACTVPAVTGVTNVAVATTNGDGEPVGGENLIVLDGADYAVSGGVITLPKTLCDPAGLKPQRKAIYLSGTCETKKAKYGVCGPHSVGKPLAPLADGGPLDGGPLDAGAVDAEAGLPIPQPISGFEPGIGTIAASSSFVYGVGLDPADGGTYRLLGYPLPGVDAGAFFQQLGGSPGTFESTSLALAPNGADLGLVKVDNGFTSILGYYDLDGGTPNSAGSATDAFRLNALANGRNWLYAVWGTIGSDGGLDQLTLKRYEKGQIFGEIFDSLDTPTEPITALSFTEAPALAADGGTIGYLYSAHGVTVDRFVDAEATTVLPDLGYVSGLASNVSDPITALAVGPKKLFVATVDGGGNLAVYSGDPLSVSPPIAMAKIASGFQALPRPTPLGLRTYGIVAAGKYVYFAHEGGISYVAEDGAGLAPLVVSPGVWALATDGAFLYWAAAKVGTANPASEGFFRVPLVK